MAAGRNRPQQILQGPDPAPAEKSDRDPITGLWWMSIDDTYVVILSDPAQYAAAEKLLGRLRQHPADTGVVAMATDAPPVPGEVARRWAETGIVLASEVLKQPKQALPERRSVVETAHTVAQRYLKWYRAMHSRSLAHAKGYWSTLTSQRDTQR